MDITDTADDLWAALGESHRQMDEALEALRMVAMSPQANCTGEHSGGGNICDCVGDKVRAVLAKYPRRDEQPDPDPMDLQYPSR